MRRSSFSALAIMLTFILLSPQTVVQGMFMDMYNKLFQAELLDDCSVYVYDRVLFIGRNKNWCKSSKSSLNALPVDKQENGPNAEENIFVALVAYYLDDDGFVRMDLWYTNNVVRSYPIVSQDYFEARTAKKYFSASKTMSIPHTTTERGRYMSKTFATSENYTIIYESCKYGLTKSNGIATEVLYDPKSNTADVKLLGKCDPNLMVHYPVELSHTGKAQISVYVDPGRPKERQGTVAWNTHTEKFTLHPIKQSIQTCVLAYRMIKDFKKSFKLPYALRTFGFNPKYVGALQTKSSITFNGKTYQRPTIENNYSEQPFFFYNAKEKKYSPLFLYYKFKGSDRRFTVRFVSDSAFYDIFTPMEYMKQCNFPTSDSSITVAAAPRVIKEDEKSISIEVYFLINNVNFRFCVFYVEFWYDGGQHKVDLELTSEINAYVHVEQRSTTAANCDYDGRTVRWLLAYSSNNDDAELVSLDDDVSSPIFPCPHCGLDSKMYCDIDPEAKQYHSSMYIQTVRNGKTEVTFVRVTQNLGYEKKVQYHTTTEEGEYYFLQNMDLKLELHEMYIRIQEGKAKGIPDKSDRPKATQKPEKLKVTNKSVDNDQPDVTALDTTEKPDEDEDYGPDWLEAGNSSSSYWCLFLFSLIFLCVNI